MKLMKVNVTLNMSFKSNHKMIVHQISNGPLSIRRDNINAGF